MTWSAGKELFTGCWPPVSSTHLMVVLSYVSYRCTPSPTELCARCWRAVLSLHPRRRQSCGLPTSGPVVRYGVHSTSLLAEGVNHDAPSLPSPGPTPPCRRYVCVHYSLPDTLSLLSKFFLSLSTIPVSQAVSGIECCPVPRRTEA